MEQPTREKALELLMEYNKSDALIKHAYAVEGVMKHFAVLFEEDVLKWSIIGLLHDLDYEMYPEQHCKKTEEILHSHKYPFEYIHAIVSHGYKMCTEVKPEHFMEKVLYTIDELTGLIAATALMRPSRSVNDLEAKSVIKKFKQSSFAAGVNREVILNGCEMIDMDLSEVISQCIAGMREVSEAIGL